MSSSSNISDLFQANYGVRIEHALGKSNSSAKSPLGKCYRVVIDARSRPMDANNMVAAETWINVS